MVNRKIVTLGSITFFVACALGLIRMNALGGAQLEPAKQAGNTESPKRLASIQASIAEARAELAAVQAKISAAEKQLAALRGEDSQETDVRGAYDGNGVFISGQKAVRREKLVKGFFVMISSLDRITVLQAKEARYLPVAKGEKLSGGWLLKNTVPAELPNWPKNLENILKPLGEGAYFLKTDVDFDDITRGRPDRMREVVAYLYDNQVAITRAEFGEYLIARGAHRLEDLVNRKIVEIECRKFNIVASDGEVESRFQEDLKSFGIFTEKEFVNSVLNRFGKTLFEWKEDAIRPKIMMEKLVRAKGKTTDAEQIAKMIPEVLAEMRKQAAPKLMLSGK